MKRLRLVLVLAAASMLCPAAALRGQLTLTPTRLQITEKDADAALINEWFGVYLLDSFVENKFGYVNNSRVKLTEDGRTIYRESQLINLKITSQMQTVLLEIEQTLDYESQPPFRCVATDYQRTEDGKVAVRTRTRSLDKGKEWEVVMVLGKIEQKKKIEGPDFTLADSLTPDLWIKRKPNKGEQIISRDLDLDKIKMDLVTSTFGGAKTALVNGVSTSFWEVKTSHKAYNPPITGLKKYTDKGQLVMDTLAGRFELRRESEKEAKDTEFSIDLFVSGQASVDKPLGDTSKLNGLVLEFTSLVDPILKDGPRQTVDAKGKGTFHLQLGKRLAKEFKAHERETKEALQATAEYPINDAAIKDLAKKAVGDAKTDEAKVKNICQTVHDFIKPTPSAKIPNISDLLMSKTGDCKSYALLFTCLARASGIPARQVAGLVYMGDDVQKFGGHAWNEVVLNGVWVPVDATLNQVDADPGHISLGTEKDAAANLLSTFGKLRFFVVSVDAEK